MILSIEPGYYREGAFGIRLENLAVVRPPEPVAGGDREMLGFEMLTLAPIDRRLIDAGLLEPAERAWLDAYHARVADEPGAAGRTRDRAAPGCAAVRRRRGLPASIDGPRCPASLGCAGSSTKSAKPAADRHSQAVLHGAFRAVAEGGA